MEGIVTNVRKLVREFSGFFLVFWGLFVFLSLVTHWPMDPSLNHVTSDSTNVQNYAGILGAYISGFLHDVFGIAAYIWPIVFGAVGVACIAPMYELLWWRWLGYFFLTLCLLFVGAAWSIKIGQIQGGGMIGNTIFYYGVRFLSPWGSWIVWLFLFTMATQLTLGISWVNFYKKTLSFCKTCLTKWSNKLRAKKEQEKSSNEDSPQPKKAFSGKIASGFYKFLQLFLPKKTIDLPLPNTSPNNDKKAQPSKPDSPLTMNASTSQENDNNQYKNPKQGFTFRAVFQKIKGKLSSEKKPLPMPKVYDEQQVQAEVQNLNDPNIHLVPNNKQESEPSKEILQNNTFQNPQEYKGETQTKIHPEVIEIHDEALNSCDNTNDYNNDISNQDNLPEQITEQITEQISNEVKVQAFAAPKVIYTLPSLDLLQGPELTSPKSQEEQIARGETLMTCLADFSIQGELVRITPGPVVTMYEVRPAAGVRVNRISNLNDDIALALKAIAIRIQAPIPGSDTVGIEIPNIQRDMVNFREILSSGAFTKAAGPLTMVLGKNIAGKPFVAELSKMPHLLVAGATGAGKSVGLNAILLSLLYTTQPHEMQLLLIDPKRIEMAVYADLPHLVHPVVTEMQYAKTALEWAVHEMDRRYDAMAKIQVRNIIGYNQKIQSLKDMDPQDCPPEFAELDFLPYLVIIIDELADLMLTAAREVETSIVRLAQLARAAGIHMILATQRPSVDVVTGIIKANFPCRMSFQVTSKHDSRTILDMVGAEHLLGKGDMLYKPSGGRLIRLHGPFVPDEEVQAVVNHWKKQAPPAYKVDFSQWGQEQNESKGTPSTDVSNDPLYAEILAFVEEQGKVSISLVQRRFKIGFNKAAVMVEQLEKNGIVGPADGSKPRMIIR